MHTPPVDPAPCAELSSPHLAQFLAQHSLQEALLRDHRLAVMRLDCDAAARALDAFETLLSAHMEFEEEVLLPLYAERVDEPPRFGVDIYRRDHEKIIEGLSRVRRSLEELGTHPTPGGALEHLDRSHAFAHLMEHHDDRERAAFFPLLDQNVPKDELGKILGADPRSRMR